MNLCPFMSTPRRRQWQPTPVLLPGKSHGQSSLVGCSPWGRKELDTTEWLHFHVSPHALEKEMATHSSVLRDGGAWWAAVYGVAQSWTLLKRLSSSSSMSTPNLCTGNRWEATLNLKKSLVWAYSFIKDFIKFGIHYLFFLLFKNKLQWVILHTIKNKT